MSVQNTVRQFCGDQRINGNEYCDGKDLPYSCFKRDASATNTPGTIQGSCKKDDVGKQGTCPNDFTCQLVGVCNGGNKYGENGHPCTAGVSTGTNLNVCENSPAPNAECVLPTCANNCASSCPKSFKTVQLQVQSQIQGAQPALNIDLYSYKNANGNTQMKFLSWCRHAESEQTSPQISQRSK